MAISDKALIQIDRAIHELRCGRAVNISGTGFLHPEFADLKNLGKLKNPRLIITPARAHALSGVIYKTNQSIALDKLKQSEIHLLISGTSTRKAVLAGDSSTPAKAALKLCLANQILPAVIAFDKPPADAPKITAASAIGYAGNVNNHLTEVAHAPLKLRDAKKSSVRAFRSASGGSEHLAIIIGEIGAEPLIRIHSSCYTGDLLGSLTCDCGDQLRSAIRIMDKEGGGVILYMMQEGRGIGLINKLRAYDLQAGGMDTVEANGFLGFDDEERAFEPAAVILKKLKIKKARLLSNNPRKARELETHGIKITKMVPIVIKHEHNHRYLATKAAKSGHLIK